MYLLRHMIITAQRREESIRLGVRTLVVSCLHIYVVHSFVAIWCGNVHSD